MTLRPIKIKNELKLRGSYRRGEEEGALPGGSRGGAVNHDLYFNTQMPAGATKVERKLCELCGTAFYRPEAHNAKTGQRDCDRCVKLLADQEIEKNQPIPRGQSGCTRTSQYARNSR